MCSAKRHKGGILSLLLMLVMIFNIAGTTLFVHSHNIDGVSIVHSHPYTGLPTSHSHTTSHAGLIARLATTDMLISEPISVAASSLDLHSDKAVIEYRPSDVLCASLNLLRAPPTSVA